MEEQGALGGELTMPPGMRKFHYGLVSVSDGKSRLGGWLGREEWVVGWVGSVGAEDWFGWIGWIGWIGWLVRVKLVWSDGSCGAVG